LPISRAAPIANRQLVSSRPKTSFFSKKISALALLHPRKRAGEPMLWTSDARHCQAAKAKQIVRRGASAFCSPAGPRATPGRGSSSTANNQHRLFDPGRQRAAHAHREAVSEDAYARDAGPRLAGCVTGHRRALSARPQGAPQTTVTMLRALERRRDLAHERAAAFEPVVFGREPVGGER
jgi:hypothetical protein